LISLQCALLATPLVCIDIVLVCNIFEQMSLFLVDKQRYANCLDRRITPTEVVDSTASVNVIDQHLIAARSPDGRRRYLEVVVKNLCPPPTGVPFRSADRWIVS